MGKRPNYGFQKRQKELKRQQKKNEKAEKKRLKRESSVSGDQGDVVETDGGGLAPGDDLPSDRDPMAGHED